MDEDTLARFLCKEAGMVWWTKYIPAVYHDQARALIEAGYVKAEDQRKHHG